MTEPRGLKLVIDSAGSDAGRQERTGRRKRGTEVREQAFEVATDSIGSDSRREREWKAQVRFRGVKM